MISFLSVAPGSRRSAGRFFDASALRGQARVDALDFTRYLRGVRGVWSCALLAAVLTACSTNGSSGNAPPRVATPEEVRRYYPELTVPVTWARPPPWCRFVNVVSARGDEPALLKRAASDLGANFVMYVEERTELVSCGMNCWHHVPVQVGHAYWCPPAPRPMAPAPTAPAPG